MRGAAANVRCHYFTSLVHAKGSDVKFYIQILKDGANI